MLSVRVVCGDGGVGGKKKWPGTRRPWTGTGQRRRRARSRTLALAAAQVERYRLHAGRAPLLWHMPEARETGSSLLSSLSLSLVPSACWSTFAGTHPFVAVPSPPTAAGHVACASPRATCGAELPLALQRRVRMQRSAARHKPHDARRGGPSDEPMRGSRAAARPGGRGREAGVEVACW